MVGKESEMRMVVMSQWSGAVWRHGELERVLSSWVVSPKEMKVVASNSTLLSASLISFFSVYRFHPATASLLLFFLLRLVLPEQPC